MDYIKLIGAALVVFAGAGFGACPVHKMKERTRELEELYFCLLRLKSEVNHGGKPLPEAIKTAADSKKEGKPGVYRGVMKQLGRVLSGLSSEWSSSISTSRRAVRVGSSVSAS